MCWVERGTEDNKWREGYDSGGPSVLAIDGQRVDFKMGIRGKEVST